MKDEFVEIETEPTKPILPIHPPLLIQQNVTTEKKKKPRKERQRKSYTLQKKLECLGNSGFLIFSLSKLTYILESRGTFNIKISIPFLLF